MKRATILISLATAGFSQHSFLAIAGLADWTNVVATLRSDGTTNLWTAADLQDALGLLNRRYWRDMESESGRQSWHGKIVRSAFATNAAGRVECLYTHEDGYTHKILMPARVASAADAAATAAAREERKAARLAQWRSRLAECEALIAAGAPNDTAGAAAEAYARAIIDAAKYRRAIQRAAEKEAR